MPRPNARMVRRAMALVALVIVVVHSADVSADGAVEMATATPLAAAVVGHAATTTTRPTDTPVATAGPAIRAREVVFIDTAVADWEQLAAQVRAGVDIVLLHPGRDGLQQMVEGLRHRTGLHAVYVISHGAEGVLLLCGQRVTSDVVAERAADLDAIGRALAPSGDVFFYGCRVAAAGPESPTLMGLLASFIQGD